MAQVGKVDRPTVEFCKSKNITVEAYSPLGHTGACCYCASCHVLHIGLSLNQRPCPEEQASKERLTFCTIISPQRRPGPEDQGGARRGHRPQEIGRGRRAPVHRAKWSVTPPPKHTHTVFLLLCCSSLRSKVSHAVRDGIFGKHDPVSTETPASCVIIILFSSERRVGRRSGHTFVTASGVVAYDKEDLALFDWDLTALEMAALDAATL